MKLNFLLFAAPILIISALYCSFAAAAKSEFFYKNKEAVYPYAITQSGDNYNFAFETNPGTLDDQFKAGLHVLLTVYRDSSIDSRTKKSYIRERAKCFALGSQFYTYTLCILPNEFAPGKPDRFRGFVTQMPNWKWLVTRNFLPVVLVFGLIFFVTRKRPADV